MAVTEITLKIADDGTMSVSVQHEATDLADDGKSMPVKTLEEAMQAIMAVAQEARKTGGPDEDQQDGGADDSTEADSGQEQQAMDASYQGKDITPAG